MGFDLLLFDCDGTLVDSEPMQNLACSQLLAEEGLPQYTPEIVAKRFIGARFGEMLRIITQETGHVFPSTMSARYVERSALLTPTHLKTIPGVEELVSEAAKHFKICVASNGQRDNVITCLTHAGLIKYFDDQHIFTAVQVKNPKPAPDLFLYAAEKMNTAPQNCIVLEDSVVGVTAAKAAGMITYGFVGTHSDQAAYAEKLKKADADEVFSSLIHIKQRLLGEKPL